MHTRRQLLSEALAKAKAFHEKWRQLNERLSGVENKMYVEWVQRGLPEPCEAELAEHQVGIWYLFWMECAWCGEFGCDGMLV